MLNHLLLNMGNKSGSSGVVVLGESNSDNGNHFLNITSKIGPK
jgi:hypothetical protein